MVRLAVIGLFVVGVFFLIQYVFRGSEDEASAGEPEASEMVECQNCATYVPKQEALEWDWEEKGAGKYFCNEDCAKAFAEKKSAD